VHKRQCSKNATQCSDQKNNNDNGCKTCVGKRREWRGVGKRVVLEGGSKISGGWDVGVRMETWTAKLAKMAAATATATQPISVARKYKKRGVDGKGGGRGQRRGVRRSWQLRDRVQFTRERQRERERESGRMGGSG